LEELTKQYHLPTSTHNFGTRQCAYSDYKSNEM